MADGGGNIVERYFYEPYGATDILDFAGTAAMYLPAMSAGYWHDHDLDGDIDAADLQDLKACVGAVSSNGGSHWPCVLVHDRNADDRVDIVDLGVFVDFMPDFESNGTPAPAAWKKSLRAIFGSENGTGSIIHSACRRDIVVVQASLPAVTCGPSIPHCTCT